MKLKVSELYLGFQTLTFKIFQKIWQIEAPFTKEIIIATLSLNKEKDFFFSKGI